MHHQLDPSAKEMKEMIEQASEKIIKYLQDIVKPEKQLKFDVQEARDQAAKLVEKMPEEAEPYSELLDYLFTEAFSKAIPTPTPGQPFRKTQATARCPIGIQSCGSSG